MPQAFKTVDVLKLEVETDPTGPVNLVQNPSGDLGAWGWSTPVAGSVMSAEVFGGNQTLKYASPGTVASFFYTEALPVAAGQYVAASWIVPALNGFYRVKVEWLDSAKVLLSSATQTGYLSASAATVSYGPFLSPASTVYARLRFDHYSTNTGTAPTVGQIVRLYRATLAKAATTAELNTVRTNLVTNPSFETNTTGWLSSTGYGAATSPATFARSTTRANTGTASLLVTWPTTSYTWVDTQITGLTPGATYTASCYVWVPTGSPDVRMNVLFIAAGDWTTVKNAWTRISVTFTASSSGQAFIGPQVYGSTSGQQVYVDSVMLEKWFEPTAYFDGSTAAGGGWTYAWTGTAHASTSTATGLLQYVQPVPYLNILGPTHDLKITRDELDVGLLNATILDATLDPAVADTIRPGRRVRVMALDPATSEWEPIFAGKATNAVVTYDYKSPNIPDAKRARIALTASDNMTQLAGATRTEGVAGIANLPYVLEGVGVPWNVNGSGNQVASATVVANNADATAVDQVVLTRDTALGYAWMDRYGVLQAWDNLLIPATVMATLDEGDYSDLAIDYDTARAVNTVSIKFLRINLATGETVEIPYGPYADADSVEQWGALPKDFTIQGITESGANMQNYANTVLAVNATPVVRVNSATLPIRTTADVAKALLDLYDLVTVANAAAGYDEDLRITGVEHTITADKNGGKWLSAYSFASDGGVAPPQITPSPATGASAVDTDDWVSITPNALSSGTLRYRVINGVVYVHINGNLATTSGTAVDLNPSARLPAIVRPSAQVSTGGYFSAFAGVMSMSSIGAITVRQDSGGARATVSGMVSYPVGT